MRRLRHAPPDLSWVRKICGALTLCKVMQWHRLSVGGEATLRIAANDNARSEVLGAAMAARRLLPKTVCCFLIVPRRREA